MNKTIQPCCLTIAGSDSGGNAGVQADLRAFHSYGLHGCTVFAALTAQNPFAVTAIHSVPADFIAAQLDAVLGVYTIRALKTGMLADAAAIHMIATRLAAHREIAKVIDPVMIATSGAHLIQDEAIEALTKELLPLATVMTPNLPEAEFLCGKTAAVKNDSREATVEHAKELAKELHEKFGCAVIVKGGHGGETAAVDVLYDGKDFKEYSLPWVKEPVSTHGTGCSFAAALAAELAQGRNLGAAVLGAKAYVHAAIEAAQWVGPNCGVLGFVPRQI